VLGGRGWLLSKFQLSAYADFNDKAYSFELHKQPQESLINCHESPPLGRYELIQKGKNSTIHAHTYRMNHPLGEFVIDTGKQLQVSHGQIVFDYSNHPTKISAVEQLQKKSGCLTLSKLMIDSFQREEHLIFTAMDDHGVVLDQEVCEKLFSCFGEPCELHESDSFAKLEASKQRQIEAKISEVLEANNTHFQAERDRLERWADDKIAGAEQALLDTKAKIRTFKRESRQAQTLDEQKQIQESIKLEERKQRRQRQAIFDVEDEIFLKRDALIDALEKRLNQHTTVDELFSIRWSVT